MIPDVLVVGGGPAGRALAAQTAARGLRTVLLDPAPDAPWRHTYGSWFDELPPDLPSSVIATRSAGRVFALTEHRLSWEYAVLDVAALRAHLDAAMQRTGVEVRTGRAVGLVDRHTVAVDGGPAAHARLVIDAAGSRQPLSAAGRTAHRRSIATAEQTAFGVVVDQATAAPLVGPDTALFMDWRPDHGEPGPPTFLYGVPLGGGAVLLEETSLAHRPGLPIPLLRRRLGTRLAHHGIVVPADAATERVLIPLDAPRHRDREVLAFGAAAPLVHPASGFSVAATLRLAPAVAHALATRLPGGPDSAIGAARAVLWPPAARAVHRFRRIGLEALLGLPPEQVPGFFELFFTLPPGRRWSYLTGRADLPANLAAMSALFAGAGWPLRARLLAPAVLPSRPAPASVSGQPAGDG